MPLIRALSIDLGWKHLAYAMLEVGSDHSSTGTDSDSLTNDFSIKAWNCESLLEGMTKGKEQEVDNVNVNDTSLDELIRLTVPAVANILEFWVKWPGQTDIKPTIAFLEQQPLGMQARNVKSKTLSHVIQGLLISKGIPVVFISPQKKLKYMEKTGNYSDNKKFAVEETLRLLHSIDPNDSSNRWLQHFNSFKKKDDLADSFLQGLYASKDYILALIKEDAKQLRNSKKRVLLDLEAEADAEAGSGAEVEPIKKAKKTKSKAKTKKGEKGRRAAEASVCNDLD
jgi:hypothetical protein